MNLKEKIKILESSKNKLEKKLERINENLNDYYFVSNKFPNLEIEKCFLDKKLFLIKNCNVFKSIDPNKIKFTIKRSNYHSYILFFYYLDEMNNKISNSEFNLISLSIVKNGKIFVFDYTNFIPEEIKNKKDLKKKINRKIIKLIYAHVLKFKSTLDVKSYNYEKFSELLMFA